VQSLREFILEDMKKREMSERQYADFVGVANSTINRATMETKGSKKPPPPSIDFLAKLAQATRVDICILVAFVYPNLTNTSAQNSIIGALASQLPADKQDAILAMLRGWGVEMTQHSAQ
jgi:transcriptional regulator with XRE-family HTH domain